MNKIRIVDIDVPTPNPAEAVRPLSDVLDTTGVAINSYVLGPGEQFGFDVHRHNDQEEIFLIQEGTASFELESDEVEVSAGEAIRFAPGEFQLGSNQGDDRVHAIAIGVPRETKDIEYLRECPDCCQRTVQRLDPPDERGEFVITCNDCGTETVRETL